MQSKLTKILISWSGGKDSCLALSSVPKVDGLLTTFDEHSRCVPAHGISYELLTEQARSLGLPLLAIPLPHMASNREYEERISHFLNSYGDLSLVFGDLHLEDIRSYKEALCYRLGVSASFPLWGSGSMKCAERFLKLGYKAIVCSVDCRFLDASFVGREFDEQFLKDLPAKIDPAGEYGEFHTFVYDGPIFNHPLCLRKGKLRQEYYNYICELEL
ncbi:MAG: ATP-binding protein [Acidobacteriota bacterium]|nr:ATP-binding protein [Blastocatellia bacterium]MDW8413402.1 ATP-binding protein [Acidobacteriota bacterium]